MYTRVSWRPLILNIFVHKILYITLDFPLNVFKDINDDILNKVIRPKLNNIDFRTA